MMPTGTTEGRQTVGNRGQHALHAVLAICAGVCVFLLQRVIGFGFPNTLDAGWSEVLQWGISHGARWGHDLVFTYGPLGFLAPSASFDPSTYWATLALQCTTSLATAWLVVANLRRIPLAATLAFAMALFALGWLWNDAIGCMMIYPLGMLILASTARRCRATHRATNLIVVALAVFAAVPPFIKFSYLPLWLVWLPVGTYVLWRSLQRSLALSFMVASVLAVPAVWLASGQRLADLGGYYYWSWQLASHYGGAMQAPPALAVTDWVALGSLAFGLASIALFAWQVRRDARRVAVYLMFAVTLALAYKTAIIRADGTHLMLFWGTCAMSAPFLAGMRQADSGRRGMRYGAATLVLAALALTLPWISESYSAPVLGEVYGGTISYRYVRARLSVLTHPDRVYRERLALWNWDRKQLALPLIARKVRNHGVDIFMHDQSVLLANNLNYRPRPVFQSYAAYSSKLARLNGDFFRSERAPDWVMLNWEALGDRYPTADDARALVRIMQGYRPVMGEHEYLLLKRDAEQYKPPGVGDVAHALPLGFKSSTVLPPSTGGWFARFHVKLTAYGKLATLLFREPALSVEVEVKGGGHAKYSVTRSIAASGFMLSPAIDNNTNFLRWLAGDDARDITAVKLVQQKVFNHRAFVPDGPLRLYSLELQRGIPLATELLQSQFPGFSQLPEKAARSVRRVYVVDGRPVVFLPPPQSLRFHLRPGTYDVSLQYGLMPSALTTPTCLAAHSDGVGISVTVPGNPASSASASIDPWTDPRHRYSSSFSHRITVRDSGEVVVSTTNGPPGSNADCDWSWIRDVRFERTWPLH